MTYILQNGNLLVDGTLSKASVLVEAGRIVAVSPTELSCEGAQVLDLSGCTLFPGFADVHVHFREPGFSYKETIAAGSRAAARGGYTAVCTMPNLDPVPDSVAHLREQTDIIRRDAVIPVYPYGALSRGEKGTEPADLTELAPHVIAFSDDGCGVQDASLMRRAMEIAAAEHKIIAAHCEDNSLLRGGLIHDGAYAAAHGIPGICSESEWGPLKRDLELVRESGCAYHMCHVSTKESVELIRKAKAEGLDVTCETAPHYLLLCEDDLQDDGAYRMNPPLRTAADRAALLEGVADGTIDMIATDHAPHAASEKAGGLHCSRMGIVGLECAFAALYTGLVRTGILPLDRLIQLLSTVPRARFGLPPAEVRPGAPADLTAFALDESYILHPEEFLSLGRSTPFAGRTLFGTCKLTMNGGTLVWQENTTAN